MKPIVTFVCCLFVMLCISTPALSEPYKDKNFPTLDVLKKQPWQQGFEKSIVPAELIGKVKISEGTYALYYKSLDGTVNNITLIILDTNIWIITGAKGYAGNGVIQK